MIVGRMRGIVTTLVALGAIFVFPCQAAQSASDTLAQELFRRYPFEQWAAAGEHADIHWSAHVEPVILSNHQRLLTGFQALIDGREMFKRRGHGEIVVMVRVTDPLRHSWTAGTYLDLAEIPEQAKSQDWSVIQQAFVLPGEFEAEIAVCDTQTREYSFARRKLRVAPLRNDPLPGAWRDLPAVEMIPAYDLPDAWYLPYSSGRLHLKPLNERSVHLELLVNITPSERAAGSLRVFRRNMGLLIPAMKSLVSIGPLDGGMDLSVADLVRHELVGEQKNIRELDWSALRKAFAETTPGVVDARALARQRTMKQYFRDQVELHADTRPGPRVLIVLSAPVVFDKQEDIAPLKLPPDANRKVIYLRYRPFFPSSRRGGGGPGPGQYPLDDDLERILKPLSPHVLNAAGPLEFRKALAYLLEEITRLGQPGPAVGSAAAAEPGETVRH